MVYVTNTTLRPTPKRVIRIGRLVLAILPSMAGTKSARRKTRGLPRHLSQSVPAYLHRDVGLPPQAKPSRMPPDIIGRTMM
ncbi:hypothetical protein [uncultured Maritimibacter sp.]|jgi:hypothetical protein|uniref:hypothetical protein n=1 Tax=uncultured Maritimibacter sp. TaxID=991866 RepID=UPI00263637AA|nr:hypothetical protein [uncultured Maritimibacter sp.]